MKENRFDHLPILSVNGVVKEFFKTNESNNFQDIIRVSIGFDDLIPLETSIKDVIEKFAATGRTFYFLTFHRDISGLITLANLNCKQVQIYIFSLICELERELGNFLNKYLSNQCVKKWLESKENKNESRNKFELMLDKYKELTELDLDHQLTELFFFVDFFNIIKEKKLYNELNFTRREWKELNSINELRIRVAHPTRSLLDKENNINQLKQRLDKMEDLTFRLVNNRKNS